MNVEEFAQKIQDVRWRLVALQGRAGGTPLEQQDLLTEAFEEFQTTLEELHVAEEELRAANEDMAAARAEVEAERQRYQDLFEFAPDGYLVTNTSGVVQEANRAVAQLLNVAQRFLVGKPLYIFFAQEMRDDLFAKLIQLQQVNQAQEWEVRLQPRNNMPFSAALTVAAICNPNDKLIGLRWLLRDITDRKKAELQESEQRFRQLAENINQVFWISDVKTAEIIYISPAYEKLWGCICKLNEECKFFIDNILPDDRDRIIPLIEKQKQGELIEAEYRIVRPSGEIRWISTRSFPIYNEIGQIYRACGIAGDITQRKQAELALWQQTKREQALNRFTDAVRRTLDLETIFATAAQEISQLLDVDRVEIQQYLPKSQIWLTVADYPQHPDNPCSLGMKVQDVENEISCQLKQFEVAQIDDTNELKDAVSQELAQVYPGAWLLVPLHFQDCLWGSWCLRISDRVYHWSEWEVDLVKAIAAQLAIAIQQGQFYQQLNELNANLEFQVQERTFELQQKVQELEHLNILKDDFLSTVSHELRTPLTNMKMSIQMLKIADLPERQQRYLDILQTEWNRETDLINDLLDLQQLQAEFYPISVKEVINLQESLPKIVEPFRYRAVERQQSLKLDISPDIPPLISHLTGLERILAELLNNACKYTPTGGEILFCISDQQHTSVTTFRISNQAEIPAAALPRIFEKFYRVPNADRWQQGGTGLGLSLVQKLVEQLGGTISVESEGGWTSFIVQFPFQSLVEIQPK